MQAINHCGMHEELRKSGSIPDFESAVLDRVREMQDAGFRGGSSKPHKQRGIELVARAVFSARTAADAKILLSSVKDRVPEVHVQVDSSMLNKEDFWDAVLDRSGRIVTEVLGGRQGKRAREKDVEVTSWITAGAIISSGARKLCDDVNVTFGSLVQNAEKVHDPFRNGDLESAQEHALSLASAMAEGKSPGRPVSPAVGVVGLFMAREAMRQMAGWACSGRGVKLEELEKQGASTHVSEC